MIVQLNKVGLKYPNGTEVLKEVSCTLEKGSFHFLSGKSGAGKSTLLKLLSLNLAPSSGKLILFDKDPEKLGREGKPKLRRRIGMVFQDYHLLPHLTVRENIALPRVVTGDAGRMLDMEVEELVEWMELKDYADDYPEVLSGGQQQKAAIARAVINKPELLLADEPTGNLDPSLSLKFMHLFQELFKQGSTILFATHDETLMSQFNFPRLRLEDGVLRRG